MSPPPHSLFRPKKRKGDSTEIHVPGISFAPTPLFASDTALSAFTRGKREEKKSAAWPWGLGNVVLKKERPQVLMPLLRPFCIGRIVNCDHFLSVYNFYTDTDKNRIEEAA